MISQHDLFCFSESSAPLKVKTDKHWIHSDLPKFTNKIWTVHFWRTEIKNDSKHFIPAFTCMISAISCIFRPNWIFGLLTNVRSYLKSVSIVLLSWHLTLALQNFLNDLFCDVADWNLLDENLTLIHLLSLFDFFYNLHILVIA